MRGSIRFDILTPWRASTGRGDGPGADSLVVRTPEGLPFLPQRTVKGLVRHALQLAAGAGMVDLEEVTAWFGSPLVKGTPENRERRLEEARFQSTEAMLVFHAATLGESWAQWAARNPLDRAHLFSVFRSTKMSASGVAHNETLRGVETVVPMELRAPVDGLDERSAAAIESALPLFLRGLGSGRHRGFGRVAAQLERA